MTKELAKGLTKEKPLGSTWPVKSPLPSLFHECFLKIALRNYILSDLSFASSSGNLKVYVWFDQYCRIWINVNISFLALWKSHVIRKYPLFLQRDGINKVVTIHSWMRNIRNYWAISFELSKCLWNFSSLSWLTNSEFVHYCSSLLPGLVWSLQLPYITLH